MFKIIFYGVTDKGLGELRKVRCNELDLNEIEFDDVSFVVVEDSKTHIKRYIFSMIYRSVIVKNNVDRLYKSLTLFGKKGLKSWVQIINYCDAEIFSASPVHVLQMLGIIVEANKNGMSFWRINNLVKEHAEKYNIKCYTGVTVE